jgi:hypothetical protein
LTVHGDDFLIVANAEQLKWLEEKLAEEYAIKTEILGPDPGQVKEVKILNRTLRWCEDKIEYEADHRHAEIIIEECEVMCGKVVKTPGVTEVISSKEVETRLGGVPVTRPLVESELSEHEKTRFRGVHEVISSKEVETRLGGVPVTHPLVESELSEHEKTRFRGVAARINYLAMDRSDLQFAAKNLCRKMSNPAKSDWEKARRIARYLKWRPRGVIEFPFESDSGKIDGYADSDWAGEKPSMKSTSGGAILWGSSTLKSWSSTQTTIALSSAEAELYAMSKCAQQVAHIMSIAADFSIELKAVVHCDSLAALGIAYRRGLGGRTRHVKVQYLWIQEAVANKELAIKKVPGTENPADMFTKFLAHELLSKYAMSLGMKFPPGRTGYDRAVSSMTQLEDVKLRMAAFAKHVGIAKCLGKHFEKEYADSVPYDFGLLHY